MVPFGLNPQRLLERYRRSLDQLSTPAIAALRELHTRPVLPTVLSASVEIFLDDSGYGPPSAWIYYRGRNNKVDHADPALFPGRSLKLGLGLEGLEEYDDRYYTDDDLGGLHVMAHALIPWFAECWWKAGGWSYPLPVSVAAHEGYGGDISIELTERGRA